MATLEDKLLGEKSHYYCSSDEEEKENDSGDEKDFEDASNSVVANVPAAEPICNSDMTHWTGNSANTGPKGKHCWDFLQKFFLVRPFADHLSV